MTPEQFSLPWRPLKALANLVSRDSSRYIINGICVEMETKSVRLIATDGRLMGIYNVATAEKVEKQGRVVLPVEWLKRFTFDDKMTEVNITTKDFKFEAEYRDSSIRSRLIEGNYPNWKQVIPKSKFAATEHFDFNPFLMKAFVRAAEILSGKFGNIVRIKSHGELEAFSIFVGDANFYGVLMGLKMENTIPAWIQDV